MGTTDRKGVGARKFLETLNTFPPGLEKPPLHSHAEMVSEKLRFCLDFINFMMSKKTVLTPEWNKKSLEAIQGCPGLLGDTVRKNIFVSRIIANGVP